MRKMHKKLWLSWAKTRGPSRMLVIVNIKFECPGNTTPDVFVAVETTKPFSAQSLDPVCTC